MKKWIVFLSVLLLAGFFYSNAATAETPEGPAGSVTTAAAAAEDKLTAPEGVEDLIEWIREKTANGELEAEDEEKARRAIEDGDTDRLLAQAQELYEKYGIEVVEEANEVINEAVGNALTTAVKGFFANIRDSVSELIKSIFA